MISIHCVVPAPPSNFALFSFLFLTPLAAFLNYEESSLGAHLGENAPLRGFIWFHSLQFPCPVHPIKLAKHRALVVSISILPPQCPSATSCIHLVSYLVLLSFGLNNYLLYSPRTLTPLQTSCAHLVSHLVFPLASPHSLSCI